MSFALNINIWKGKKTNLIENISGAIKAFSRFVGLLQKDFDKPKFLDTEVLVESTKPTKISFNLIDLDQSMTKIEPFLTSTCTIIVKTIFPLFIFNDENKTIDCSITPLSIRFFGKKNINYYRLGDIEVSFDDVSRFSTLIDLLNIGTDNNISRGLSNSISGKLEINYDNLLIFLKFLIQELKPDHALVGTADTEINPITSHTVYHRDLKYFLNDLYEIARLHEKGGFYFDVKGLEINSFYPPRIKTLDYGYLKKNFNSNKLNKFNKRVQELTDFVSINPTKLKLDVSDIENCLIENADLEFEDILDGYLVSSRDKTNAYIENLYFCLYNKILADCNI